jgi:O-antigen/teichoic acid export membrane protein
MLKKIVSSTISQVFSKVITAIITIFLLSLITNYLSVELFGVYNKIFNYIFIFAFLVDLWLYAITIKEISANKNKSEYIFWNILTLRLFSGIFVIFFSILIAYFLPWYNDSLVLLGVFIASIFTFFSLINSNLLALMQAHMKMEFSVVSVVFNKLFVLLSTFLLIKYFFPFESLTSFNIPFLFIILSVSIWMFINMILNYLYSKTIIKIWLKFDYKYIKEIFFKSLPYWIALFLSVVYTKIDIVLISLIEKGLIADRSIALYSLPLKIMDVFMIIASFFMNSLLPSLSQNYKNNKLDKIEMIINNAFKVMWSAWIIIISLWLILKNNIVELIANSNYLQRTDLNIFTSADAFSVIFFMILFFYIWIIFSYLLIATDNQKKLLKISIILTIINIIWNILLIPHYSFIWAWLVTVLTQVVFLVLVYTQAKKIINFKIPYIFMLYVLFLWLIIYLILSFLVNNYYFNIYTNILYSWIWFFLYSFIIFYVEKRR